MQFISKCNNYHETEIVFLKSGTMISKNYKRKASKKKKKKEKRKRKKCRILSRYLDTLLSLFLNLRFNFQPYCGIANTQTNTPWAIKLNKNTQFACNISKNNMGGEIFLKRQKEKKVAVSCNMHFWQAMIPSHLTFLQWHLFL